MNFFGFGHSKPTSSHPDTNNNKLNSNSNNTTNNSNNNEQNFNQPPEFGPSITRVLTPNSFPTEMVPHMANPTISLSDTAYAVGTTIKGSDDALNRAVNQFEQPSSNLTAQLTNSSNTTTTNNNHNNNNTNTNTNTNTNVNNNVLTNDFNTSHYNTVALPIESDTAQDTAIPRGKLRISIIEANGLNVHSQHSNPYVVCTFESSEFVTHGPESFDTRSPSAINNNTNTNTNNNNNNNTQSNHTNQTNNTQQSHNTNNHINNLHLHSHNTKANIDRSRKPLFRTQTSSHQTLNINRSLDRNSITNVANPIWHHKAMFDVVGAKSELDISVYDSTEEDSFLGHVRIMPQTIQESSNEQWLTLKSRIEGEIVTGKIRVKLEYSNTGKRHYGPEDFEVLRLLGKGTFGQVFQVKKLDTARIYAMKVLSKKVIVRKKEIAHTIGERDILVRTSSSESPFIVGLKFSFQTPTDLYLVTDYMSGGELFWHLQKEGRFSEDRAKFYIAELVLALEHLHDNDIVYRDLKPENILLDANGHIALCDFGLSKANLKSNGTTNTFCGTTEYLAPEVLLDETGYTKMVDFWSLGVLIFEMCCGWSPFYADNTQQMYKNIAFGKVRFPKEILSQEGRSFVKGLLNRNPNHRLGAMNDARELRAHPFFHDIDWVLLREKKIPPPFIPHIANELDTSNFDPEFTNTSTSIINKQMLMGTTPLSQAVQENFKGFTYVDDSMIFDHLSSLNKTKNNNLGIGSYRPGMIVGSLVLGNTNLPPEEEVIHDEEEELDEENENENDNMDVDDEFVNGQFDL